MVEEDALVFRLERVERLDRHVHYEIRSHASPELVRSQVFFAQQLGDGLIELEGEIGPVGRNLTLAFLGIYGSCKLLVAIRA